MKRSLVTVAIAGLLWAGCKGAEPAVSEPVAPPGSIAAVIENPTGPGSGEPFLSTGVDGSLLMSWLEPVGQMHALKFARYQGGQWSEPVTIVERPDLFVNWADFPSIVETGTGSMMAHWLQSSGDAPYAYDVKISISRDGGKSWSEPLTLHDDGVAAEHGFVSLVPELDHAGTVGVVWLDGRNMTAEGHGADSGSMTLRFARIHDDGSITDRTELDGRVCECCQTSLVESEGRFVAIYRDRSTSEIRDIGIVHEERGGWSEPALVHEDGWEIAACPVNGPQLDAIGSNVAAAWFSGATGTDRVLFALSRDGGRTFGEATRIDEGDAIGRVDTLLLDDETAMVIWLGETDGEGRILARYVGPDGAVSPIHTVGRTESSRAAGFPRMALVNGRLFVAWTEPGEPARIRVKAIDTKEIS